jgi:O-acetyl-ADP-ribose deacetylase (regulator of RNase III)
MGKIKYVKGNLITKALFKDFDAITHGCNCQCVMGGGIAVPFRKGFKVDQLPMEDKSRAGDYNKLGCIDFGFFNIKDLNLTPLKKLEDGILLDISNGFYVINSYTQFHYSKVKYVNPKSAVPLDYEAVAMCFDKINHVFKGMHLGIPQIGAGLAGGNWDRISAIIEDVTPNIDVTCVIYNK